MCCDAILATDDPRSGSDCPRPCWASSPAGAAVTVSPGAWGLKALDAILTEAFPAKKAWKMGMVDRLTKAEYPDRIAADLAMGRKPIKRKRRGRAKWLVDRNLIARAIIRSQARKGVDAKAHGNYLAPYAALDLVMAAPGRCSPKPRARGRRRRRLATGPVCKSLVGIFASEAAKKLAQFEDGRSPERVRRAAVVGGGIMGGGIASLMADKKVEVRLADLSRAALDAATWQHRKDIASAAAPLHGSGQRRHGPLEVSVGIGGGERPTSPSRRWPR